MAHHGKNYRSAVQKISEKEKQEFSLEEAILLLVETSKTKFDATAEIHVNTGCDPRHADQIVRSTVVLPHGTGKTLRVAVFCEESKVELAKSTGADIAGGESLIEDVLKGDISFDIAIATPGMMKNMAKIARVLGPKGLMPSPKSGNVTDDIEGAISELKKGKIEFKTDKTGIIHSAFGKVSFGAKKLEENCRGLLMAIVDAKPSGVKGTYLQGFTIASTMGPGIRVSLSGALSK
jgi:large subunit ribosomal protein L1